MYRIQGEGKGLDAEYLECHEHVEVLEARESVPVFSDNGMAGKKYE